MTCGNLFRGRGWQPGDVRCPNAPSPWHALELNRAKSWGLGFWGLGFRVLGFMDLGFEGLGFRVSPPIGKPSALKPQGGFRSRGKMSEHLERLMGFKKLTALRSKKTSTPKCLNLGFRAFKV